MKKLEEHLYELRKENKLTQEEVAVALNVTRQTISNWETGTAIPTINKAIELAQIYGISLDTLVGNAKSELKKVSVIMKKYEGTKGTLFMHLIETQPFYPFTKIKNVEIIEVESTSMKIRIHKKDVAEQLIFLKDVLGFLKEVQ
ncbi:MAG TPA: helix-turn-helix transcriptional regulator [Clostridiales bacterium]|nr:helix-turn-helix transcriptional regulator [Clostridiales bacterium]